MKDNIGRIRFVSIIVMFFAIILVAKLYMMQVVSGDTFAEKADRQYTKPVGEVFSRGSIFFQARNNTQIAAATLRTGYTVAINPKLLGNADDAYNKISTIIELDKEEFLVKAMKSEDPYEEIAKKIPEEKAKQIDELNLAGVNIYKEKWRYYPADTLAAHVLGFVGFKGEDYSGRYGLENFYDKTLSRKEDTVYVNFFAEIFTGVGDRLNDSGDAEGDIVLTLEPNVQTYVEKQIQAVQSKFYSKQSGVIIMDPKTGEIIAMAAAPTYNPNSFQTEKNVSVFTNPLVQNVYEMGSIIKPLTMAAGIDSGVVNANTKYEDKGYLTLNTKTIYNFDKKGRGLVDMQEVLSQSLNTGVAYVANKMGNDAFAKYMLSYGIGEKTGIDLPNEANGIVSNLKSKRSIEMATASYGQGIAMTPIETIRALGVLANDGKLTQPHVVKRIDYKVGYSKDTEISPGVQVLKPETAKEISRMLTVVVDKALLDGKYKKEHYSISAKTGTAEIANPGGGGYYDDRYLHSFFGYFPSYNPKFIIFLYTLEPQGEKYASHTLTEPFMNITNYLINYYEVPPDR